jgi:hypothetical protein
MESILYSRTKLSLMALAMLGVAAVFMMIFLDPDMHLRGAAGMITNGWTGHFIFVPAFELGLLLIAWRIGYIATGSLEAIMIDQSGVRVTTLWTSAEIPWSDLILPRLVVVRTRYGKRYSICFDRHSGRSLRVSASLTTLGGPDAYQAAIDVIGQMQYAASRKSAAPPAPVVEAVSAGAAPAPVVRGFGRKGALG